MSMEIIPKVRILNVYINHFHIYESCSTYILDCSVYRHSIHCKRQKTWPGRHFLHLPFPVSDYWSYRRAIRKEKAS